MTAAQPQQVFELAVHHHQKNNLPQAEAFYRQALESDPAHADALHLLGVLKYQTGLFNESAELLHRAVEIKPASLSFEHLALALTAQGKVREALVASRRALALSPDSPEANCNLGDALFRIGHIEEAACAYRAALELRPEYSDALNSLGRALLKANQIQEAIEAFSRATILRPEEADPWSNLSLALFRAGDTLDAKRALRRALAIDPNNAQAQLVLSQLDAAGLSCNHPQHQTPSLI